MPLRIACFLLVITSYGCASVMTQTIEIDESVAGIPIKVGDNISIYTKKQNILTMKVTEADGTMVKGNVTVVDGEKISAKIHEVKLAEIDKIQIKRRKRNPSVFNLYSPWAEIVYVALTLIGFKIFY